ncbi:N-acetyltransferase family protein [Herbiconiux sp. YIM B11900]|uniref:GNAT family N-acetyltransferase n=1 Tax=Herbiconiux sp. YIM B11900 TaxID=3404131 RepID=UPI003F85C64C
MQERRVVRADSPGRSELDAQGWVVIARSWGAGLVLDEERRQRVRHLVNRAHPLVSVREVTASDVEAVLALDRATADDYPGDIATAHDALTTAGATPTATHRGWGAFTTDGLLVAMTFADTDTSPGPGPGPGVTETDFTVVRRGWRRLGLGSAVKAACVLALADEGHTVFRTGGSFDNPASIAANRSLGYELDEEWLTYVPGGPPSGGARST